MKTLPEQARITASMIALGEHIAYGRDTELLMQLADKAEALTKERDALTLGIDQWRVDYHELRLERDTLAAAAKLALDLINDLEPLYWDTNKDKRRHTDAVAALREALK